VAGAKINVPVANPAYCNGLQPYVVLEGDNAFRIAQRAGIPIQTLGQINHLDANYTVYVTDVICLP
jgi:LysM repeat protein